MLKKRFGFLAAGWLPLLMGVLLIGALGATSAQAQTVGSQAPNKVYVPLQNTYTTYGDSAVYKLGTIKINEGTAATFAVGDSLMIEPPTGWQFVQDSAVTVTITGGHGLSLDSVATSNTQDITSTVNQNNGTYGDLLSAKMNSKITTGNIYLVIKTASATTADTVLVSGLYVRSTTTAAMYDSSSASYVTPQLGTGTGAANIAATNPNTDTLVALPGAAKTISFAVPGRDPSATQTVGNVITTQTGGTAPASVDTSTTLLIQFTDAAGNLTSYSSAAPSVVALLHGSSTSGNGTLGGTGTTHWYGAGPWQHTAIAFDGLTYTKAEDIDLKFTFGSSSINTSSIVAAGMTFGPGSAANISVALQSGSHDTVAVGGSIAYTVTVTDAYFNPVSSGTATVQEATNHGATFTASSTITLSASGTGSVTFQASRYFVGLDTLQFTAGKTVNLPILITAGPLGGVIADYSSSATGSATTENIATGTGIYLRAYLRDTYGNPINATDTSAIAFAMSSATAQHGGALTQSGKSLITVPAAQASVTYGKPLQDPVVAVDIPYAVSDTIGNTDAVTATTSTGGYSASLSIPLRSNVPAKMKMYQSTGTDSSVIVSNYANSIAFSDSLWDKYGNIVSAPSSSYKVAPTRSSYAIYFATNGLVKFVRSADTTAADTLYPTSGVVTRTASSGKTAGMDTVKTWAATNSSLAKSAPVWVTPGALAKLVLTPEKDSTAIAGQTSEFTVQKEDAYGNHIDWGVAGNLSVSAYKTAYYSAGKLDTANLNPAIRTQLASLVADTIATGANHPGGYVGAASTFTTTGTSALASVGGTLNAQFPFTAYAVAPDTQLVYATLSGLSDTSTVYSMLTGVLAKFKISIPTADSVENAGTAVPVTVTAEDSAGNRIYTYYASSGGINITLNNTNVAPVATKDTTFYFTVIRNHNEGTVKAGDTLNVTGASITDTLFNEGQATFWLKKFTAENTVNTVTFASGGFTATTTNGTMFKPLAATGTGSSSKWAITGTDTLSPNGSFTFTIVPRDMYYNVDSVNQYIVNVSSNQTSGFNVGSNPKVVKGMTSFSGTLSGATGSLIVYVFNSDNSGLYASKNVVITGQHYAIGDVSGNGTVTAYDASLILKYVVGDTTLTAPQLAAADVSGDGTVSAYDASLILRYVAKDTTVDHYFMSTIAENPKSEHMTVSSITSSGSVSLAAAAASGSDGVMNMPVSVTDPQNVYAVEMSLNVGNAVDVQGVTANLPQDWQLAYHTANGVLKIAMAGTTPLSSGKIATIAFKIADQSSQSTVTGTATINENAAQALGSMEVSALPTKFGLDQNYPNPFNPTTTIKYQLAKQANVTLNIYSITGQLVRTLVSNNNQNAGYYTIVWNGLNNAGVQVASGVYFYRLQAGSFLSLKKMLLLK